MIRYEVIFLDDGPYVNFWYPEWTETKTVEGREPTLMENVRHLKEFKEFERILATKEGLHGWVTWVSNEYPEVQRLIVKLGGRVFKADSNRMWYKKEIN